MKMSLLLLVLFGFVSTQEKIAFKTRSGDIITVSNDRIYYNNKIVSKPIEDIIYASKYNRIIEQDSSVLLFLEIDGRPNLNRLEGFKVTKTRALKLVECLYNDKSQGIGPAPFTDMDGDGNLEIGGFDLTEAYSSKGFMYYNPSKYYEIKGGSIVFDSSLTRKMDIKVYRPLINWTVFQS